MPATSGLYGGKDAKTPSGQLKTETTQSQQEAAARLAEIGKELWESTRGLRKAGTGQLEDFLTTGRTPESLRMPIEGLYREGREDLESQYNVAREQLLNQTPTEGGQLNDQLRDLSTSRAQSVGGLETNLKAKLEVPLAERMFQTALGVGFGQPPVAISGLSSAGGQYGAIAGRAQAEQLHREQAAKDEWAQIGDMMSGFMMT